jgi:hypothetical protein
MYIVGAGRSWDSGRDVYRWSWRILGWWEGCVSLELENLGIVGGMCIVGAGGSWYSGRDVYRWSWRILGLWEGCVYYIVEPEDDLSRILH